MANAQQPGFLIPGGQGQQLAPGGAHVREDSFIPCDVYIMYMLILELTTYDKCKMLNLGHYVSLLMHFYFFGGKKEA